MIYADIIFALACLFKAVADTLSHHFDTSVFKKMDVRFWNPAESWKYVKFIPLTRYRPDAWHLSNSAMIIGFIFFAILHEQRLPWYYEVLIYGVGWNILFWLFYDKLLRRK